MSRARQREDRCRRRPAGPRDQCTRGSGHRPGCVKAGSSNQDGGGPEFTDHPGVGGTTISHSSGKDISHYSVDYDDAPGDDDDDDTDDDNTDDETDDTDDDDGTDGGSGGVVGGGGSPMTPATSPAPSAPSAPAATTPTQLLATGPADTAAVAAAIAALTTAAGGALLLARRRMA